MNWYTADTHFGHESSIKHSARPFKTVMQMDAVLIENLSSRLGLEDALWIVGDFVFGPKAKDRDWLNKLFGRFPGTERHVVIGNHDGEATQRLPWASVTDLAEVADSSGLNSVLCHYPMNTWHRARKGEPHLCGHVHEQWMGRRNAVNVGVDVWGYEPVALREAQQRAATLPTNADWSDVERNAQI
ncbi:metallophosphoesterase [Litoreibacter roseus]|uniref:Calcineurin-like phosphoesterase family protein n=1 Tax=Litoreibacter roseus TaxID=2601869 RepID=A0A6N6JF01_9RHOB|nr:metallophosphoesterase [Litoreibacter roseus]GFE64370.1 hypothetical protein KIN_14440 [Litoreibacter roseus]